MLSCPILESPPDILSSSTLLDEIAHRDVCAAANFGLMTGPSVVQLHIAIFCVASAAAGRGLWTVGTEANVLAVTRQ